MAVLRRLAATLPVLLLGVPVMGADAPVTLRERTSEGETSRVLVALKAEGLFQPGPPQGAKGGEPACSNFSVAGPMTEWILLGTIALRVEGKLEWDSARMRITNNADANKYIKPFVKKGWTLKT